MLEAARGHGLRTHMDGARLMNAAVASGVPAAHYAGGFDTAWLDFTKGLGAPVGAVLCGSRELIDEAWRWKQMMGGSFRQSGIVAAGCLYALEHHVERLADDHELARTLAGGMAELGADVVEPETNIVIFAVPDPAGVHRGDGPPRRGAVGHARTAACGRSPTSTWTGPGWSRRWRQRRVAT